MACTNPVLTALTPEDFKNRFKRGFNYLPVWSAETTYNIGDVVYYESNGLFYTCLINGTTSLPTETDDWQQIPGNILNYVLDEDITEAYAEACMLFNEALFDSDADIVTGYLYLAAHFLVIDLNMGGAESVGSSKVTSRSVGSISESYQVPDWMNKQGWSNYITTQYGVKYAMLVYPKTIGRVKAVWGGTRA